jgi:hypothetical protein
MSAEQKTINVKVIKDLGAYGQYDAVQDIDSPEKIYVKHKKNNDAVWYRWYKTPDLVLAYGEPDYPVDYVMNIVN